MAQVFRKRANLIADVLVLAVLLGVPAAFLVAGAVVRSDWWTGRGVAIEQPVPFSHRHHVGQDGIDCRYCHVSVEKSQFAGLPSTDICMSCHSQLWTDAAMLEPVRRSLRENEPIRWQRVHDLPDFVYFNHSIHVAKGVGCESCHGRVDRLPLMSRQVSLQMSWCLDCHREPEQHLRPRDKVFEMGWQPPENQLALGRRLATEYRLKRDVMLDCNTCHR